MTRQNRKIVASCASVFLLLLGYYGSYLPFHKSGMCASAEDRIATATSVSDIVDILSTPLDQPSPIGRDELVTRAADLVAELVDRYGERTPGIIKPLIQFVEHYHSLYAERAASVNAVRNLISMGRVNISVYQRLHEQQYLHSARRYFEMGRAKSPMRPQFIYALFDVDVMQGDLSGAKEMAALISTYWPQDSIGRARVAEGLARLQQGAGQPGAGPDTGRNH